MSINENSEVKLFGFRISRTGTIILFFISLTICFQFIPELYYFGALIFYNFINSTFPEILANIDVVIQMIFVFFILFTLISFLVAILIICVKTQKSLKSEDISVR